MNRALSCLLVLLALGLSACAQGSLSNPAHRSDDVASVPVEQNVEAAGLTERLTRWVDGSQAWDGDRRAGYWVASQTDQDTIIAELDTSSQYLRTELKVKDDEVEIRVENSDGLSQAAMQHVMSLRRTIRTALRSDTERDRTQQAGLGTEIERREDLTRAMRNPAQLPAGSVSPQLLGNYHALVIGNDAYARLPRLRTAVADARAVASLLEQDYGFEVTRIENADRKQIVSAMNAYRSQLGDGDSLLIYYAGHGWFDEDAQRGYWLPTDATQGDPTQWVSNATITDMLRAIPARHVLVVADSCYSGTLTRGIRAKSQDRHLARLAERRSRTALTSGGLEPVEDGAGQHSVFATAFVSILRDNDEILDAQSLFTAMRRPVMLDSDQTPEYSDIRRAGHDGGDFLFAPRR